MHCFWCSLRTPALHLNEHEASAWLGAENISAVKWLPADEGILPLISAGLDGTPEGCIIPSLKCYIESEIIPRYDHFDKGHDRSHVNSVIAQGLELCRWYDVNPNIIYTAAAYHDTGICEGRETHHTVSARIIRADSELRRWFTGSEIDLIANAAEDHRASSKNEPRGICGKILAEADRQIDPEDIIRRTVLYGLDHYPELDKEGHWQRTLGHMHEKYAEGGYLKLWIPESPNAGRLAALRSIISDEKLLRKYFEKFYLCETKIP
ncbi:MAG: HD domain-containing protein [Bacteroidales bacterium]|nr:HD domain-containing protein [Bacteroidales bacterium]